MAENNENPGKHGRKVHFTVNDHPVVLEGGAGTGAEIKAAAIAQGVHIQPDFELQEELPNGEAKRIEDNDQVHFRENLRLVAFEHQGQVFVVTINDQPVTLRGETATGTAIKAAAIAQGVHIQPDFVLEEERPDGTGPDVGDDDEVQLRKHLRFVAFERQELTLIITVNEQPVTLPGKVATGAEIKQAAIAQGVLIQQNFVLQEELPNGTSRIIGDNDKVHLRKHLRFTAIAPDDNS